MVLTDVAVKTVEETVAVATAALRDSSCLDLTWAIDSALSDQGAWVTKWSEMLMLAMGRGPLQPALRGMLPDAAAVSRSPSGASLVESESAETAVAVKTEQTDDVGPEAGSNLMCLRSLYSFTDAPDTAGDEAGEGGGSTLAKRLGLTVSSPVLKVVAMEIEKAVWAEFLEHANSDTLQVDFSVPSGTKACHCCATAVLVLCRPPWTSRPLATHATQAKHEPPRLLVGPWRSSPL